MSTVKSICDAIIALFSAASEGIQFAKERIVNAKVTKIAKDKSDANASFIERLRKRNADKR
jgi:hypothetical protein